MQPEPQPPVNPTDQPQPDVETQTPYQSQPDTEPQTQPQPEVQSQPASEPVQQPAEYSQPVAAAPVSDQPAAPERPAEDPGKLFGILGLVCAFIAFHLPGLILSIIGRKKSKKAGYPTTLSTVGIVLNIIFMIITLGALALIATVAYQGVQQRAEESNVANTAISIMKKAEVYGIDNGTYPTLEQLRTATGASQLTDADKAALKDTDTPSGEEVGYQACTDEMDTVTGASVYIYSTSEQQVTHMGFVGSCESIVAPL